MKLHIKNIAACVTTLLLAGGLAAVAGTDSKDMKETAPEATSSSDAGFYLAGYGGANFAQDYGNGRIDLGVEGGLLNESLKQKDNSNRLGLAGGLKAGYNFESFPIGGGGLRLQPAVELDGFYLGTKTNVTNSGGIPGGGSFSTEGNMNDGALMVNGLLRLKTGTLVTPYIGAGIGGEYLTFTSPHFSETGVGTFPLSHNSDDICLALEGIAGVDFALTKHWSIFTEYKFLAAFDPNLNLGSAGGIADGASFKFDPNYIGQSLGTLGLKYSF